MVTKPAADDTAGEDDFDIDGAMASIADDLFQSEPEEEEDGSDNASDDRSVPADKPGNTGTGDREDPADNGKPAEGTKAPGDGTGTPASAASSAPEGKPDTPPQSWTAEAKAHWATIPPRIQQEILKREDDFFKGIEQYKQEAVVGRALREAVNPYLPIMRQHNIDVMGKIQELLQLNYEISTGSPEKRAEIINRIAKTWGVDLATLQAEPEYIDPAVSGLKKELATVKSGFDGMRQAEEERVKAERFSEVNAFLADPANIYIQEVVQDMVKIFNGGMAKGLKEAYDVAVQLNPVTRAKEQQRLAAEAEAKRVKEESDRVAAAKAATAANVKSSGRSGRQPETAGSIDDTISSTLKAIKARG